MFPDIVPRMVNPVIAAVLSFARVQKGRIDESQQSVFGTKQAQVVTTAWWRPSSAASYEASGLIGGAARRL